jgi:hypothetical protein
VQTRGITHGRILAALLAFVAALACSASALATQEDEEEGTKTVAIKTEGPKAAQLREIIAELLPEGVDTLEDAEFTRGMARLGLPGGRIAFALTNPRQKPVLLKVVRKTINAAGLQGAFLARIRARRGLELLLVYTEGEGEPLIDTAVPLKGGRDDWKEAIGQALAPVIEELTPAEPEPEPEPEEEEPEQEEPEQEEPEQEPEQEEGPDYVPNRIGSEIFSLHAGVEFGGRFFSYSESPANSPQTRPYDVFGTPGIHVGGEVYPVATEELPFISDLGLTISYMHAFGVTSETEDGTFVFDSTYQRLWAGLNYRFRLADRNSYPVVLNINGRFGMLNYTFEPQDPLAEGIDDEVAEAGYLMIRPGLDARFPVGEIFAMMPSFGYLGMIEGGEVYDRFTEPTIHGIDMGFAFAFIIDAGFEIRGGVEYTRIFSSFEPVVGDLYVAGGALDQLLALRLGAAYAY